MTTHTQPSPLTDRQREVVQAIYQYMLREQRPPTRSELACALGVFGTSNTDRHLAVLHHKGYLSWQPFWKGAYHLLGVTWEYLGGRAVPTIDYSTPEGMRLLREVSR